MLYYILSRYEHPHVRSNTSFFIIIVAPHPHITDMVLDINVHLMLFLFHRAISTRSIPSLLEFSIIIISYLYLLSLNYAFYLQLKNYVNYKNQFDIMINFNRMFKLSLSFQKIFVHMFHASRFMLVGSIPNFYSLITNFPLNACLVNIGFPILSLHLILKMYLKTHLRFRF